MLGGAFGCFIVLKCLKDAVDRHQTRDACNFSKVKTKYDETISLERQTIEDQLSPIVSLTVSIFLTVPVKEMCEAATNENYTELFVLN